MATGVGVKLTVPGQEGEAIVLTPPPLTFAPPAPSSEAPLFMQLETPGNGNGEAHAYEQRTLQRDQDEGRDEVDETEGAELEDASASSNTPARRETIEWMFETLRSGLEGVYVEEVDTPAGAAADQAKTYTDLIGQLSRQLDESLRHAHSGTRYMLCGDGAVRSLDETLLDVFRRACRLLFRAAVGGAVGSDTAAHHRRILVACNRDSRVHEHIRSLLRAHPGWQVFVISEGFRQLPMVTRLYGPTHVLVEMTSAGALWDQLRLLQGMPEARGMSVIGIADPVRFAGMGEADADTRTAALAERGIARVVRSGFEIERELSGLEAPDDCSAVGSTLSEIHASM
jgi:hypothetical protein